MTTGKTLGEFLNGIYGKYALGERLDLNFGGCAIEVRSNSSELIDKLGSYYRGFLAKGNGRNADFIVSAIEGEPPVEGLTFIPKQPDPGKPRVKEEYVDLADGRIVRKRLTGMVFLFGDHRHVAVGPCVANDNQVVNFINSRYIQWLMGWGGLLAHAAGVSCKGRGIALAGSAGMGKSTLAMHIMSRGVDFVSNDRLVFRRSAGKLMMHGLPKMPRINPGTALNNPHLIHILSVEEQSRFSSMSEDDLWKLEHKFDADIDDCFGPGRFHLSAEMFCLVLLNWHRHGGPVVFKRVDLEERPELMPVFMKNVGLFFDADEFEEIPDFSPGAYRSLLDVCPVIEISGGSDFRSAADACLDMLRSGTVPETDFFFDTSRRMLEKGVERWAI